MNMQQISREPAGREQVQSRLDGLIGQEIDLSDWVRVDQETIKDFALATGGQQWIHVDEARAENESPFGGTIAQGFLLLALLGKFTNRMSVLSEGVSHMLNYGLDKVRWLRPVTAGSRVRNRMRVTDVVDKGTKSILVATENTLEIEGQDKAALIANWLVLLVFED